MEFCTICECSIERGVENDLVMPTCDDCAEFDMEDVDYDGCSLGTPMIGRFESRESETVS